MSVRVGIVGGGLAGLSTAFYLTKYFKSEELEITIFEAAPGFGGRFNSWQLPEFPYPVDNAQHLITGSCHNSLDFFGELLPHQLKGPEGFYLEDQTELPAVTLPWSMGLFKLFKRWAGSYLKALYGGWKILCLPADSPAAYDHLQQWLELNQPAALREIFWSNFIGSVFNTSPRKINFEFFQQWFGQAVLNDTDGLKLYFFRESLKTVVGQLVEQLEATGIKLLTGCRISRIRPDQRMIEAATGQHFNYHRLILALPPPSLQKLLSPLSYSKTLSESLESFSASPIISVHYRLDSDPRVVSPMLLETGVFDWLFSHSPNRPGEGYLQLLKSNADDLLTEPGEAIARQGLQQLESLGLLNFQKVTNYRVIKNPRATYLRPPGQQCSPVGNDLGFKNIYLAGDWTVPDWPATIEAAISSGKSVARRLADQLDKLK